MHVLPIATGILKAGDDLAERLWQTGTLQSGDIIVISSKAVATIEGAVIALKDESDEAFESAVREETKRLHGKILPGCAQAMLCELQPEGLSRGTILAANAGLDRSNVDSGFAIGWPRDPVKSVEDLHKKLSAHMHGDLGIIMSDSCCHPRRDGVTAYALVVAGFNPIHSRLGEKDLFGRSLRMTKEATADQLATAANFCMGNGAEGVPAAIIRNHQLPFSSFTGWVEGIEPKEDLFRGI